MAGKLETHRLRPHEWLMSPFPGPDSARGRLSRGLVAVADPIRPISVGDPVPPVRLTVPEGQFDLAAYASGWLLVWCFPGDDDEPFSVDEVMGRSLEEHRLELAALDCALIGISSQHQDALARLAARARTSYPLLSDPGLVLAGRMRLPTVRCGEEELYRRLVFIAHRGRVARVFHRVRPLACAAEAVGWLAGRSRYRSGLSTW